MTGFDVPALAVKALAITMLLLVVVLQVVLARCVMRDAEDRGLDPALWGTVVFISSLVGLAAYAWLHPSD